VYRGYGWAGPLYSYVKSAGVYKCPDDATASNNSVTPPQVPISYAMNRHLTARSLAVMTAPASTVLLHEVTGCVADVTSPNEPNSPSSTGPDVTGNGYLETGMYETGPVGQPTSWQSTDLGRHTNMSNYLLADGHAKSLHGTSVSPGDVAATPTSPQGVTGSGADGFYYIGAAGTGVSTFTATFSTN